MSINITPIKYLDLEKDKDFPRLAKEYTEESVIEGLPQINLNAALYTSYENAGVFCIYAARQNDTLIGFASVLTSVNPKLSILLSMCESLFVEKEFRKTGAGLKLIRECEAHAKKLGSPGLIMSAPLEGVLINVLPSLDYVETNRLFFRKF